MGIALDHLSEADRIRIAEGLFTVASRDESKGELHGLCPIHGEKNPSFSYNHKHDAYNCFSCGATGDLLRLWSEVKGYGRKEGFRAFCEAQGIDIIGALVDRKNVPGGDEKSRRAPASKGEGGEPPSGPPSGPPAEPPSGPPSDLERIREMLPPLPPYWIERLGESRGWSKEWIEILDLRLQTFYQDKKGNLKTIKTPERVAIPIRDALGVLRNIRLWKPGGGPNKIVSWAKSTGAARLFPARPLHDPAKSLHDDPVLLCEGESDTICALSKGFNAITQTAKLSKWTDEHTAPFKGRDVVIAYDADLPGQRYANHAARNLSGIVHTIKLLTWPDYMGRLSDGAWPKDHGEDLTDFFVKHAKQPEDLNALIDEAKTYEEDPGASDSLGQSIHEFFEYGVNKRYSFKPRLLAEKIIEKFKLLSDPETGFLYQWNGRFWDVFEEDHIKKEAIECLGNESQKSRIEDAVYQAKMLVTIPHGRGVNDREEWICLQNGMLNYLTFEVAPHDPEFYCTHALPVSFDPESTKRCERWEKFQGESIQTPETIAQLQEFAGYLIVRHTKYEKCLFLLGPGADGKSTFMKIMKEMVGKENCAAVSFPDLENEFHRSSLYNKLLNISTEIGGHAIESQYFKAITSGDPINAAYKHQNVFEFSPYCKLIFAGNMLPRVKDNSDGFFRKILPIQFKRQFLEGDPDRDPELFDKLKGELSEIFYWALCGLRRLTDQKRFTNSDETRKLLMGYRRSNNPVLCYVEDQCVIAENKRVAKQDIYSDYRKYCGDNGYMPVNKENFFRELNTAVHNIKSFRPRIDGTREYWLEGIGIAEKEK